MPAATTSAVIASGETASNAIDLDQLLAFGLVCPATVDGTSVTFTAATTSGGTFKTLKNSSGSTISYTIANSSYIALNPADFYGVRYLKLVTSAAGADRTYELVCRHDV